MKIEKISDNQVKCTLSSFELSLRNLKVGELAYGSEQVKSLFAEMMQKAYSEVGFDTEDYPVMIETIPMKDDGVELFITRVEEPEELDARFARFVPQEEDIQQPTMETPEEVNTLPLRIFEFENIDKIIEAAGVLNGSYDGNNSLYKDNGSGKYYLLLDGRAQDPIMFASTCNVLSEYGHIGPQNYSGKAYLDEHFEVIIKNKALEALGRI